MDRYTPMSIDNSKNTAITPRGHSGGNSFLFKYSSPMQYKYNRAQQTNGKTEIGLSKNKGSSSVGRESSPRIRQVSKNQPHEVESSHNLPPVSMWLEYLRAKPKPSQRNGKRTPRMWVMNLLGSWRNFLIT